MSTAETFDIWGNYQPHKPQQEFHRNRKRHSMLAAGTRGGKTYGAAMELVRRIYEDWLHRAPRGPDGFLDYWCVAPIYPLGEVQQRYAILALGGYPGPWIRSHNKSKKIIELHGDVRITFRSAERYEALVAEGLNGVWVDEAARVKKGAWAGALRGRLADRRGWSIHSTTPLGHNWFYTELVALALEGDPDHSIHTWGTAENTTVPGLVEEVETARRTLPEAYYRREYEASFEAFIGQIYEAFAHRFHVYTDLPEDIRFDEVRYGVDWGFTHPGVILVAKRDSTGCWWVVEEQYKRQLTVDRWIEIARKVKATHGEHRFLADPSRPDAIKIFRNADLAAKGAKNEVMAGIDAVARLLQPVAVDKEKDKAEVGLKVNASCKHLIEEFLTYRWNDGAAKEEPVKENDHCLDALRYLLHHTPHDAFGEGA